MSSALSGMVLWPNLDGCYRQSTYWIVTVGPEGAFSDSTVRAFLPAASAKENADAEMQVC
jgi:hypothetical protein